jgi:hypothetical protein
MFNMFDLIRQAQGGAAFDNLARAYGMSPDQMRAMTAALTPAFAQGFMRQSQSDQAAQRVMDLFQTETYARAFEAQAAALDPATRGAGEDALGALFGSKEVSRAVAAQAAAASGVQAEIIRKVLPTLASILVGGFMKAAQGAGAPQGQGAPFPGPFGDVFGQAFSGGRAQPDAPRPEAGPQNPFQDWMDAFSRAGAPADSAAGPAGNPMGDVMGDILKSMFGGTPSAAPAEDPAPRPSASTEKPPAGPGDAPRPEEPAATPFDDIIETGRELSAQNAKAMERIFDAFFSGEKKA